MFKVTKSPKIILIFSSNLHAIQVRGENHDFIIFHASGAISGIQRSVRQDHAHEEQWIFVLNDTPFLTSHSRLGGSWLVMELVGWFYMIWIKKKQASELTIVYYRYYQLRCLLLLIMYSKTTYL